MFNKRMILLEFNELCPSLTERFMSAGRLPAFQRFHSESLVYTTRAQERAPYLDPWIQWVTVHTGLNHDRHRIEKLNQAETCRAKRIWDVVSEHGGTAWICGSMSASYRPGFKGALIPDPWTTTLEPTPALFRPYLEFIQSSVLESTNERAVMSRRRAVEFVRFMIAHGLSARTAAVLVKQILTEWRGRDKWKRATILDRLQFDLFRHYWQRERPTFSTLFLNSTAHFQHLHWREMEPELFQVSPTPEDIETYRSTILFGYQNMNALLARVMKMADDRTTVVLATALSQQPCLTYEHQGGKGFFRPMDFERLLAFADVTGYRRVTPVMAHEFQVEFDSEDAARNGDERLRRLRLDERQALSVERRGNQVCAWCAITTAVDSSARLVTASDDGQRRSENFFSIFYKVEGIKSGMHHPDGLLWIRRPTAEHRRFEDHVPLDLVAPTLLAELGIPAPDTMRRAALPGFTPFNVPCAAAV
jgi:hypothetical protein